jgi:hypothetical protein
MKGARTALWIAMVSTCVLGVRLLLVGTVSFGSLFRLPFIVEDIATAVVIWRALHGDPDRLSIVVVAAIWLAQSVAMVLEYATFPFGGGRSVSFAMNWLSIPGAELVIGMSCLVHLWRTHGDARPTDPELRAGPPGPTAIPRRATVSVCLVSLGIAIELLRLIPLLEDLVASIGDRGIEVAALVSSASLPIITGGIILAGMVGKMVDGALRIVIATYIASVIGLIWLFFANAGFSALMAELISELLIVGGGLVYLWTMSGHRRESPLAPSPDLG